MEGGYSLFVNGLPWEMTWRWLQQIFKGEGEVIDIYVSRKARWFNICKFGFVRFKMLDEAMKAVRNLDGVMIRGRRLKVSFARYDKNGLFQNGSAMAETMKETDATGEEENHGSNKRDGRSFKDVVEGRPQYANTVGCLKGKAKIVSDSKVNEHSKKIEMVNLKGIVWSVVEEIINSTKLEEIIRNLGALLEGACQAIEAAAGGGGSNQVDYRKETEKEKKRKEGDTEQGRAFLEEELVESMMHSGNDSYSPPIGAFELFWLDIQYDAEVELLEMSVMKGNSLVEPNLLNTTTPAFCSGLIQLGPWEDVYSGPDCPPGFEDFRGDDGCTNKAHTHIDKREDLVSGNSMQISYETVN